MDAGYYQVWLSNGNNNITNLVSSLKYEDSLDKDDMVKFTLTSGGNAIVNIIDRGDIVEGSEIQFLFGFKGGKASKRKTAIVKNAKVKYGQTDTLNVEAFDKGPEMKKFPENKIWNDYTMSEIAEAIASKNSMDAVVDKTTRKRRNMIQGQIDDFEFMHKVQANTPGWIFYITGKTLYFVKRGNKLKARPQRSFTRGASEIITFETSFSESTADGTSEQVTVTKMDPLNKEVKTSSVNDNNLDTTSLGGNSLNTGSLSDQGTLDSVPKKSGKFIPGGSSKNTDDDLDKATALKEAGDMNKLTGKLTVTMEPGIEAGDIITLREFALRDSGNWMVTKATHTPGASALTAFELKKNASNKAVKTDSTKIDKSKQNTTEGPSSQRTTVTVSTR